MTGRTERCIVADPGKLTGQCVLERAGGVLTLLESVETGPDDTVPWFREMYARYGSPVDGGPPIRVVMESFRITPETGKKSQEASHALRTQGALEQACRDHGYSVDAIAWFRPDQKKAWPNPLLKRFGLWHVGGKGHALDAIRHGLSYLATTGDLRR